LLEPSFWIDFHNVVGASAKQQKHKTTNKKLKKLIITIKTQ